MPTGILIGVANKSLLRPEQLLNMPEQKVSQKPEIFCGKLKLTGNDERRKQYWNILPQKLVPTEVMPIGRFKSDGKAEMTRQP
jgi:hypothetical protein